ncbi:TetR/AcrR family transcriptional regulator [Allokutzneria sp. NRRL B-24872]|uniref:TetR/AcrR family transcriptional regulator n=1 Tax=Allokutzneria sp. NRRL B-24872 TaxID=1137961 RepID=UPI000A3D44F4|nr:TetR/AcrR family transcriptional regulator [Allokutzneria sp. NRRL B-24872]
MPGGRPRAFDIDAALDIALEVFWRNGYDGTSVAELTAAMGITKPSLYAAFGNKEELFTAVLARYVEGPGAYAAAALDAPTGREVVEGLVLGAVELTAQCPGCLTVRAVHASGAEGAPVREAAVARRKAGETALRRRLERAGDLPAGTDAAVLAALVHTVTDGIAVQAAAGRGRSELLRIAELAVAAIWPAAPQRP